MVNQTIYSVDVLRSGQPRPYADTEREYLVTIEKNLYGKEGLHPWVMYGDVEAKIINDEAKFQREWALKIVRALCQDFREKDDDDGRSGMSAYFYPTLKALNIDAKAGTIRAFIIEPYTD